MTGISIINPYLRLMRLDRPIGTFLLLWPTLWALWLASNGRPDPGIVLIFIAGTFVMRSAGCAINDYADRDFDANVERTRNRPLATGELSPGQALIAFIALLVLAFLLVIQLNSKTIVLSVAGALVAALYPFAKRLTHLPQLVLGVAFSWGIPMSYTALTGSLPWEAWVLFAANFVWIVAYDTQYAMADREDDLKIGIKSTAILFGRFDNLVIGLLHLTTLIILALLGQAQAMGWHFYLGLFAAALFALYQQYLCRRRDRNNCFTAFLNNNWFGAMVFIGIVLGQLP
ncbi:MAG: 4-hydroxybenzoate octaprenyltransferase [bacterium]